MLPERRPDTPLGIDTRRYTGRDVLIFIALAALVTVAFWDVIALGRVFFFRDFSLFFYPKRQIVAEAVRQWRIPYWHAFASCGEPVLGSYQVAVFYPLALIYYLFPLPQSLMWFVVIHFLLSGAGAYHMMRVFGARRPAAAFTAFAWAFSPAFIGVLDYVSFHTSLCWMPWCLAFARRIVTGARFRGFFWLSVCFAMAVLAAAPEPVIFIAALVMSYVLWESVRVLVRSGWRQAWQPPALAAAALAVAVALAGVEVAPFWHSLQLSARQRHLVMEDAGYWSADLRDWKYLFLPRFYLFPDRGGIYWSSQHWLKTLYVGVSIPFLAFWTLCAGRRRRNIYFAFVTAILVIMALGMNFPVWKFLYAHVPVVPLIRFPVKFFLPAAYALVVLAGFAVDDFLVFARRRDRTRPMLLLLPVLLVAAGFLAAWWAMGSYTERIYKMITPPALLGIGEVGAEQAAEAYLATQWSFGRSAAHLAIAAAALIAAGVMTRMRVQRPYGAVALVLAVFLDVGIFGAHLNPVAGPEIYTERPSHMEDVPHGASDTRVYMTYRLDVDLAKLRLERIRDVTGLRNYLLLVKGLRFQDDAALLAWLRRTTAPPFSNVAELNKWLEATHSAQFTADVECEFPKETFWPNMNLLYQVPTIDGFEPLRPRPHHDLVEKLVMRKHAPGRETFLARMWGAGVVLDSQPDPPGFAYCAPAEPGTRAVVAGHFIAVENESQAESVVVDTTVDVTKRIVLVGPDGAAAAEFLGPQAGEFAPNETPPAGRARVLYDEGNRCAFEVDADSRAILFVADNYYPNFAATVDGKPAPLWRANYSYRAVPVEAGRHTVQFVWRPYDLYAGVAITCFAVLLLFASWRVWGAAR